MVISTTIGRRNLACVIGDLSMVRALGACDIPVAVVTNDPGSDSTRSRYCNEIVDIPGWVTEPDQSIAELVRWGKSQSAPPVLFYQGDHDLLAISRARDDLSPHFRFVLPPSGLVEELADKALFFKLAEREQLMVPDTLLLDAGKDVVEGLRNWDRFPCVIKPYMRTNWFQLIGAPQKALRIETRGALGSVLEKLTRYDSGLIVQAAIEGGEENILSYHAYVRPGGDIVVEFTGRKIRTYPRLYGVSTYVTITDDEEVIKIGREIVEKLDFSGVLKIDFKQDVRDKKIYMLEINPRFNLWHHPATIAGVSIPKAVYQDCVEPGSARPAKQTRSDVRWIDPWADRMVFQEYRMAGELTRMQWLAQMISVDVNEGFRLRDPQPWLEDISSRFWNIISSVFRGNRAANEDW